MLQEGSSLSAIALEGQDSIKALSFQMERKQLVEEHDVLKSEEFSVIFALAELYLKNRLGDQFQEEIVRLKETAKTAEERAKITELETQ